MSIHFKWIKNLPYIYRSERIVDEKAIAKQKKEGYTGAKKVVRRGVPTKPTKVVSRLIAPYWKYYYQTGQSWKQILSNDMIRWMMVNEPNRIKYLETTNTAVNYAKKNNQKTVVLPSGQRKNITL